MDRQQPLTSKRVAIYARYSSSKQRESSIEDQVARCRAYVVQRGGVVPDDLVFADYAISGSSLQRPAFEQMMRSVRDGGITAVVTEDISRISRDFADFGNVIKEMRFLRAELISLQENASTEDAGAKLTLNLKALIAEQYIDDLRDKTHRGLRGRAERGFATGLLPYGYRSTEERDARGNTIGFRPSIDAETARTVVRIFELSARGRSYGAIAGELNAGNVAPPRGNGSRRFAGWAGSGIRSLLFNVKYTGDWTWNRRRFVKAPGTNRRVARPREEGEFVEHRDESLRIIPEELWTQVHDRLQRRGAPFKKTNSDDQRGRRAQHLLSGLLVCDQCGSLMTLHGGTQGRRYYRCDASAKRGTCDMHTSVREDVVRRVVLRELRRVLLDDSAMAEVQEQVVQALAAQTADAGGRQRELRDRLARIKAKLDRLVEYIASGAASSTVAKEITALEQAQRADEVALRDLEAVREAPIRLPTRGAIEEGVLRLWSFLERDLPAARVALLSCLGDSRFRVAVDANHITVRSEIFPLALVLGPETRRPPAVKPWAAIEWHKSGCGGRI